VGAERERERKLFHSREGKWLKNQQRAGKTAEHSPQGKLSV